MTVIPVRFGIMLVFYNIMVYHHKTYCWPTREKIQELLLKNLNRFYSLSWIDDCLGSLKKDKFIVSYRNWGRYDDGTVYNKASNRQLTKKALTWLRKAGVDVAKYLWGVAKKITKPLDPSPATREELPPTKEEPPRKPGESPFLDPGRRPRLGLPAALPFDPKKT